MNHPHDHAHGHASRDAATDPVCGMTVDPANPKGGSFEHDGTTYHFCNPKCREKFAADPLRYLQPAKTAPIVMAPVRNFGAISSSGTIGNRALLVLSTKAITPCWRTIRSHAATTCP